MTREEIRKRILYLLNEDVDNPVFFTEAQANTVIQEAMEVLAEEVTELRREGFIVVEPGRFIYMLPELSDVAMTPLRIWSDSDQERLDPITMKELDDFQERWMESTGDKPEWWYPVSHDAFGLWPIPVNGGQVLRVEYLAWPETLGQDTDRPNFKEELQDLLVLYGQYDGLVRQWEPERALDIFFSFAASFRDGRFKSATHKFQQQFFNRDSVGSRFARP